MIRSKKLRDSANGQECTLNIAGVCLYTTDTTVLAHLPDESHGMAKKSDDISAAFACDACHAVIDGRVNVGLSKEEKEFYMRRGQTRTTRFWYENGFISIKGAA